MLYIFDSTEKLITTLPEDSFFNAIHREVLNGENTFQFTIPAGNEYVVEGNLVAFRDLDSYWQVFEIKRLVDVHGDGLTRTAYCEHICYELLDDIVIDKRPSADATAALAGMLENTRWQVGIVDDLGASSTSAYYESALSAVQKVANAWQGELNWRCVISGGVITRYVDLLAMRGTDTGKQFAYSKDILNIEREVDSSGVVTALYGRGKGIELDSGSYGRRLTFADVVAADKPAGQEWVGDAAALAQWGRPGNRHRFDVFVDEEETDPAKLLQKTRDELGRRKVPRVTYRLDVVSLEELTGYEHEKVRLGDLVRVIDREFDPELVVSARVIEIERDLFDPTNTKVVLGSFAPTIVEATINTARRVNDMANRPFNTKWLDGKINVLQNAIENTQSYVFQTGEDGILILDAPTYEQATKAMKLGGGIFAIANQKDGQGGWNWRTFGDGSGFTADLITAGMIDAGLVQIGPETTFAPGYDPTQISVEAASTMGVDADCLGLWHFDGSLNSHKGVAAIGDESFDTGCFGQAVLVEEETTNLQPDPNFDNGMTGKGSTDWGGGGTVTVSNGICIMDNSSSTTHLALYLAIPITANTGAYTVSIKCRSANAVDIPVSVYMGVSYKLIGTAPASGEWVILSAIYNNGEYTTNPAQHTRIGAGQKLQIDWIQTEQKDHATPFVDGTRLGVLKAPTTGLSASQGTINFRAKNLAESANGSVLVDLPKSDNTQGLRAGIANDGKLYITDSDKVSRSYTETSQADFQSGTLTDVVATSAGDLELKKEEIDSYTKLLLHMDGTDNGTIFTDECGKTVTRYGAVTKTGVKKFGTASAYFDGTDDYLTVPNSSDFAFGTDAFTIDCWVKTSATTSQKIIDKYADGGAQVCFAITPNGTVTGFIWKSSYSINITSSAVVNDGNWHHVAFVVDSGGKSGRICVDGAVTEGTSSTAVEATSTGVLNIGRGYNDANHYNGYLDELRISKGIARWTSNFTPPSVPYGDYKTAGTRIKEVDISGAVATGGTKIEWAKTTPANTAVKVETALSTDGGSTYGTWQEATSGNSIPGITSATDLSNARLKIRETLSTTDTSKTPQLHSLSFSILESAGTTVYGPNKSTLTGWDSISLAWKPERLSLVVNDEEACYIENPGLPASLGSHVFIGTDRNGNNAINTLVDELRIDKVYREVNIRTGWHKTGVPFYTSEDMKQWPGYMRAETDGLKVYDSSDDLRVLVGSWLKDAVRKYGIKIIDGEIYSTLIRSGEEGSTTYVELNPTGNFRIVNNGITILETMTDVIQGGSMYFSRNNGDAFGLLSYYADTYPGFALEGKTGGSSGPLTLRGSTVKVLGDFKVAVGSKFCIQETNYGRLGIHARESPEIRFVDEGMGTLIDGECRIDVDPIFLECIEPHTPDSRWYVNLTPYGKAILYVDEIGDGYFVVKDYNGNANGIEFTWSLSATRKDYALIRFMEVLD